MRSVSRGIDRIDVTFDDPNLVANAGLILVATLSARLGLEALINQTVHLSGRVGGALPGRKILTLIHTMVAGGSHIDHADMLRAGATQAVLGFRVMAPSTLGTFLRSFTFGHIRQLDKVLAETIRRAWTAGGGPGPDRLVIDIDSTITEVHGHHKQGAGYGYTRRLGYHPLLATRADTGEVLHARMRKGSANTQRGANRFVEELVARVRRAGAAGPIVVRADSGFWSAKTIVTLGRLNVRYSITVAQNHAVKAAIAAINEDMWIDIVYPAGGAAQVAETTYNHYRLVVRRTRLTDTTQAALWPDWRHHAFVTDVADDPVNADQFHRHPRRRRVEHPRPERRRRTRTHPLRELPSQRRLAHLRRAGPQPHPLDSHPRRHRTRHRTRPSHRRPHHPHPLPRPPRPTRQPGRETHPPVPDQLAMGPHLHPNPRRPPNRHRRPRLTTPLAARPTAHDTPELTNQTRTRDSDLARPHTNR